MADNGGAPVIADIRLLGPLEVDAGGVRVALGGPRQRSLLGLLALRAPDIVPRPQLIDGIWGEDPPGSATKTLHAHVAYLRRALGAAGLTELIVTRPPGYALDITLGRTDARRFEELVVVGRRALRAGANTEAAEALRAALRLWRGDVLSDCPLGEWARAEVAALRESRLYATEDLYTAKLALGEHARVAAELEALVARDPLRERLWELLMIALYRSGRQGEALGAYRRVRTALVEELGIEPGRRLRETEAAILADDAFGGEVVGAGPVGAAAGSAALAASAGVRPSVARVPAVRPSAARVPAVERYRTGRTRTCPPR